MDDQMHRARIMLIDDELDLRKVLNRRLEKSFECTAFERATDALAALDSGQVFDVIFCDLNMPSVSGIEFRAELSLRHPELLPRLVFMTGGGCSEEAETFLREQENPPLIKPFELQEIVKLISRLSGR